MLNEAGFAATVSTDVFTDAWALYEPATLLVTPAIVSCAAVASATEQVAVPRVIVTVPAAPAAEVTVQVPKLLVRATVGETASVIVTTLPAVDPVAVQDVKPAPSVTVGLAGIVYPAAGNVAVIVFPAFRAPFALVSKVTFQFVRALAACECASNEMFHGVLTI